MGNWFTIYLVNKYLIVQDEEDIPQELRFSDEYLEILSLKKLRKEKLQMFQSNGNQVLAHHTGFEVRKYIVGYWIPLLNI